MAHSPLFSSQLGCMILINTVVSEATWKNVQILILIYTVFFKGYIRVNPCPSPGNLRPHKHISKSFKADITWKVTLKKLNEVIITFLIYLFKMKYVFYREEKTCSTK